jgi:hypothetical protein
VIKEYFSHVAKKVGFADKGENMRILAKCGREVNMYKFEIDF